MNTPGDDILALEGAPPGSDPEQQVLDAMSEETLTGKILGMREPYRTPCRLMLLEGRTAAEAAALCGRPQKTVGAQIYRAKENAGGADPSGKAERRWNCFVKMAV